MNRCARLRAVAQGCQTLLSAAVHELVASRPAAGARLRDVGEHRLRDLQQPEPVFQLHHPDLPDDFPPLRSLDALPNNLPLQVPSFVGRERELAEVKELLGAVRLLTLTFTGGAGKTRLALHAAADLVEAFADAVWLVGLAAVSDEALAIYRELPDERESRPRPPRSAWSRPTAATTRWRGGTSTTRWPRLGGGTTSWRRPTSCATSGWAASRPVVVGLPA